MLKERFPIELITKKILTNNKFKAINKKTRRGTPHSQVGVFCSIFVTQNISRIDVLAIIRFKS
jgi:hypothetical protein